MTAEIILAPVARPPVLVAPPSGLDDLIEQIVNPHPDIPLPRHQFAYFRTVAIKALAELQPKLNPVGAVVIEKWLWPIADAVEFGPTEDEFRRRVAALVLVADTIPGCAWSTESQRRGILEWRRFPSVAAIAELVSEPVRPLVSRARALRLIIGASSGK